ncbi:MAG TPA: transporter substrate-binding domain-containing protein [Puia sp.]|jgi:ABC-type nitrate/sulfonate/bicarbonate transport system substrate-binding protein
MRAYEKELSESLQLHQEHFDVVKFINGLHNELFDFVEDICLGREENLRKLFPPMKNADTEERAFDIFYRVPYTTFEKISRILERIFRKALDKSYADKSLDVIKSIIALTANRKTGLSESFILGQIDSSQVDDEIKSRLAVLLSKLDTPTGLTYWANINVKRKMYMAPAVISAYKKQQPLRALEVLASIAEKPANFTVYGSAVETALRNLLLKDRNLKAYTALEARAPEWVKRELRLLLESPEFVRARILDELQSLRNEAKEITIGISLFPDLLLMQYAYRKKYFDEHRNYSFNITLVNWNEIFDRLMKGHLDFIIANRAVANEKNLGGKYCHFITPYIEYRGYSILIHKDSELKTYAYLKDNVSDDKDIILKMTLDQLRPKKTTGFKKYRLFASKNTDHYTTLIKTLGLVGLTEKDFDIVSQEKQPNEGYQLFEEKKVDIYVGGLPQRLLALKSGAKELLTQNEAGIPFTQVNGLICRTASKEKLADVAEVIDFEWFNQVVRDLNENRDAVLGQVAEIYNEEVRLRDPLAHTLDVALFKQYWDDCYLIPQTPEEFKRLNEQEMISKQEKLKQALQQKQI